MTDASSRERAHARFRVDAPAQIAGESAVAVNMSQGGAFLLVDRRFREGSGIGLTVELLGQKLEFRGTIVRIEDRGETLGVAVRFSDWELSE